ncbi:MAG: hypothetical protein GXO87_01790 [Chlorobi bacterium]|nr:hypothetical protein [Chlorobiota bacterium]
MTLLDDKYHPEEDFEKEEFSEVIRELKNLEYLTVSPEAKKKLFDKLEKIQPKKPFSLLFKNYFFEPFHRGKTVPAFSMLAVTLIIFLFMPAKKIIFTQKYLNEIKNEIPLSGKYQTFNDDPEDALSVFEEDTNGDGSFNIISYDLNNDGLIDFITFDMNHDNVTDLIVEDKNNDGLMDYFEFDLDFDSHFDYAGIDITKDEIPDKFYIL